MTRYQCPKCDYGKSEIIMAKFAGDCPKCNDGTALEPHKGQDGKDWAPAGKPPKKVLTIGMVARGETEKEEPKMITTSDIKQ